MNSNWKTTWEDWKEKYELGAFHVNADWNAMDSHYTTLKYKVNDNLYFVAGLKPVIKNDKSVYCYAEAGIDLSRDDVVKLNNVFLSKEKREAMLNEILTQKFEEKYNSHDRSMTLNYFDNFREGFRQVDHIMNKGIVLSAKKYNLSKGDWSTIWEDWKGRYDSGAFHVNADWNAIDHNGTALKFKVNDNLYFVAGLKSAIKNDKPVCCYAEAGIELTHDDIAKLNDPSLKKEDQEVMLNEILTNKFEEKYSCHDGTMSFRYFDNFPEGFKLVNEVMDKGLVISAENYNFIKEGPKWERPFNFQNDFVVRGGSDSYIVLSATRNEKDKRKIDIFIGDVKFDDLSEEAIKNIREGYSREAEYIKAMSQKISSSNNDVYKRTFNSAEEFSDYMSKLMEVNEVPNYSESRNFKKISDIKNDGIKNAHEYYARYAR